MAQNGQAGKIRRVFRELGANGRPVRQQDVAAHPVFDLITDKEKQKLFRAIRDLHRAGELERVKPGVYVYRGRTDAPQIRERMWAICRARGRVTIADLEELAGASWEYAKEFLALLVRQGIAKKLPGHRAPAVWAMLATPAETPVDNAKAARLERIRKEKKKALAVIDQVTPSLISAAQELSRLRIVINDLPEDEA